MQSSKVGEQSVVLLSNYQTEDMYRRMYVEAIAGIQKHLVLVGSLVSLPCLTAQKSEPNKFVFIAELEHDRPVNKMVSRLWFSSLMFRTILYAFYPALLPLDPSMDWIPTVHTCNLPRLSTSVHLVLDW